MIKFNGYIKELNNKLEQTVASDLNQKVVNTNDAIERFAEITIEAGAAKKNIFFIGNGASAAMASHMAADSGKNAGFRTRVFTDLSLMTAISNDISYDEVYANPLLTQADENDVLITISSSGNSPNIIRAIEVARKLKLTVVTLSGKKPDNASRAAGDLNFYVPSDSYGIVECAHQAILHCWMDLVFEKMAVVL